MPTFPPNWQVRTAALCALIIASSGALAQQSVLNFSFDKLRYAPGDSVTATATISKTAPSTIVKAFRSRSTTGRQVWLEGCYGLKADSVDPYVHCSIEEHPKFFQQPLTSADDLATSLPQVPPGSHRFEPFTIPGDAQAEAIWLLATLNYPVDGTEPNLHATEFGWVKLDRGCTGGKTQRLSCTYVTPAGKRVDTISKLPPKTVPKPHN